MSDWQPIETVPKDGRYVVFLDTKYFRGGPVMRWNERHNRFETSRGNSSGMNDEIAWSHWSDLPLVAPSHPTPPAASITPEGRETP